MLWSKTYKLWLFFEALIFMLAYPTDPPLNNRIFSVPLQLKIDPFHLKFYKSIKFIDELSFFYCLYVCVNFYTKTLDDTQSRFTVCWHHIIDAPIFHACGNQKHFITVTNVHWQYSIQTMFIYIWLEVIADVPVLNRWQ